MASNYIAYGIKLYLFVYGLIKLIIKQKIASQNIRLCSPLAVSRRQKP